MHGTILEQTHKRYAPDRLLLVPKMQILPLPHPSLSPARSLRSLAGHPPLEEDTYSVNVYLFSYSLWENILTNSLKVCTRSLSLNPNMQKLHGVGRIPPSPSHTLLGSSPLGRLCPLPAIPHLRMRSGSSLDRQYSTKFTQSKHQIA